MPRSIDELLAQADELADRFEDYEPRANDRGEPALMALRRAAYRRALIERELIELVRLAREAGASWTKIGKELGTRGEAARQRYTERSTPDPVATSGTSGIGSPPTRETRVSPAHPLRGSERERACVGDRRPGLALR
jgi:hypothetical protein